MTAAKAQFILADLHMFQAGRRMHRLSDRTVSVNTKENIKTHQAHRRYLQLEAPVANDQVPDVIAEALPPHGWTPHLRTLEEWRAAFERTWADYPERAQMLECFAQRPDLTRADFMLGCYEEGTPLELAQEGWFATATFLQAKLAEPVRRRPA